MVRQRVKTMDEIPRRARVDQWVRAERLIQDAVDSVEAMAADPRLTQAVILLGQARAYVADFVDGVYTRKCDGCEKMLTSPQSMTVAAMFCSVECMNAAVNQHISCRPLHVDIIDWGDADNG